jgi:hypothetical protein
MTSQVIADTAELSAQPPDQAIPAVTRGSNAMDQNQWRPAALHRESGLNRFGQAQLVTPSALPPMTAMSLSVSERDSMRATRMIGIIIP